MVSPNPRLGPPQRLGQPPVDDQGLTVLAEDDVARLQVAVQDAARMRVVDGIADVDEPPQELAQFERPAAWLFLQRLIFMKPFDRLLEDSPPINRMA